MHHHSIPDGRLHQPTCIAHIVKVVTKLDNIRYKDEKLDILFHMNLNSVTKHMPTTQSLEEQVCGKTFKKWLTSHEADDDPKDDDANKCLTVSSGGHSEGERIEKPQCRARQLHIAGHTT